MSNMLFTPLTVRNVMFRNRIVVSPMCQYSSEDGFANDWHLVHLGSRAVGGAGLVISEATAVSPEGRISPDDLGIWKDEHIDRLERITSFIHAQGSVAGIQLAHAGRKASTSSPWKGGEPLTKEEGGWDTVAPSSLPFKEGHPVPHELTKYEIAGIVGKFRDAALRAYKAGFRVIEIHAAHGYLLNEFMSPATNIRKDEYGGDFGNRVRLLYEVVDAVREVWPVEFPLFVRVSSTDYAENGWTLDESIKLAKELNQKEVDLVDCSSGGNLSGVRIKVEPLYQLRFAEEIKKQSGILTGAVGMITTAEECEMIIREGKADLVFLAREFLRDPYFPIHAALELEHKVEWPLQYERAGRR